MSLSTVTYGDGAPIVVLPGLGLDARFMAAATEPALSDHVDYTRIYVSLPGAGSSADCDASSDAILDVLTDWVDAHVGIEPFALVGHSYGGYLGAALARRLQEQVDRVLLVCSGVKITPSQRDLSHVLPPDTEPGWLDSCPTELHDHLRQAVGNQRREVGDRLAAAFATTTLADNSFLAELRQSYQLSDEQSLSRLDRPVTFVTGRRDQVVGFRDQFAASQDCSRGTYVLVASAGHYLPVEAPGEFRAVVASWLRH